VNTTTFESLDLSPNIFRAIQDLGFESPTQIQAQSIPLLRETEGDFIGQAQTGTGKTAAFLIPLLEKIDPSSKTVQSLILAPTRELANQIEVEIQKLGKYTKIKSTTVYGGSSYERQIKSLRQDRPQIVVGTPGRVLDLIKKKFLKLDEAKFFVLDEADEMLNMGFLDDVKTILEEFNEQRQLIMFSATMPRAILDLIKKSFRNYEMVKVKKEYLKENIDQKYFIVRNKHLTEALARLIDVEDDVYAIVFCKTKIETKEVGADLRTRGHKVEVLNGDMGQSERDYALRKFKEKKCNIIVCTDVAARGIDVQDVTHVFNYGLPQSNDSYVHRIGRTARAGRSGKAYTLVTPRTVFAIRKIERDTQQVITAAKLPKVAELKKQIVRRELETLMPMLNVLREKGSDFKTDESFNLFKEQFGDLERDEILKLMFTWKLNKTIRHYNNLEEIEGSAESGGSGRSGGRRRDRSRSRDRRSNGRRGDDRGDRRSGGSEGRRRASGGGRSESGSGRRRSSDRSNSGGSRSYRGSSSGRSPQRASASR